MVVTAFAAALTLVAGGTYAAAGRLLGGGTAGSTRDVAIDIKPGPDGAMYFTDREQHRVRRLGADGDITTVVGAGHQGFSGDGGPATEAQLDKPIGSALAPDGTLYVADWGNHRIRRVSTDGTISTYAGNGGGGFSGDGGPATAAQIGPSDVSVGPDGSVYFIDDAERVRRVSPGGTISTLAGNGDKGLQEEDGVLATEAPLNAPAGVAASRDGSVYFSDADNALVWRVDKDGSMTRVAGTPDPSAPLDQPASDRHPDGDGGPATDANLVMPNGIALAADNTLYIADRGADNVRRVTPDGIITTVAGNGEKGFAGDGGPATAAQLKAPIAVGVAGDGRVLIADYSNHRVRQVGSDGRITSVVRDEGAYIGIANKKDAPGLVVDKVTNPAVTAAGVQPVDVIVDVDGRAIHGSDDLREALAERHPGDEVQLTWQHGAEKRSAPIPLMPFSG